MARTVNDVHSALNETVQSEIIAVDSLDSIRATVARASNQGEAVAIAGGRHSMGGQQFCAGGVLLDTRGLNRVLSFDAVDGMVEVEAGIMWPDLIDSLRREQPGLDHQWGIAQKQTGADELSIGGALAANVHSRGLTMKPFVSDVEKFRLVLATGDVVTCSRTDNAELFHLVAGGYGLLGCVYSVTLRLVALQVVERVVELQLIDDLINAFEQRITDGYLYGDFQFYTDEHSEDFLRRGVFSCYRPVEWEGPLPADQRRITPELWNELILLAHTDKSRASLEYSKFYLSTSGQVYHSDAHQLANNYVDGYHRRVDELTRASAPASEMITEIFVPRERLADFMEMVRDDFRAYGTNLIYGTIRLIEADEDSYLRWATDRWACIIFNLCTPHTPDGVERSAQAFRRLIDRAIERGGSYYLPYHRWASREQIETCYPQMREFLALKRTYDPEERFQSDWYRHHRDLLEGDA